MGNGQQGHGIAYPFYKCILDVLYFEHLAFVSTVLPDMLVKHCVGDLLIANTSHVPLTPPGYYGDDTRILGMCFGLAHKEVTFSVIAPAPVFRPGIQSIICVTMGKSKSHSTSRGAPAWSGGKDKSKSTTVPLTPRIVVYH